MMVINASASPDRADGERGSGTIMLLTIVMVMLLITGALGVAGRYLITAQQARAAADLAALAGAQAFGSGQDGCAAAESYAVKNGHQVADCSTVGDPMDFVLTVTVEAPVGVSIPELPKQVTVTSHAGPVR